MREMSSSSSPTRSRSASSNGDERPRFFDKKAKNICWANAEIIPGRHPERWRKDAAGNVVCKRFCNCNGCLCFEYDHIVPFSKGGESTAENCQILQTRVNRFKSDKDDVDATRLKGFSCDLKFSGMCFLIIFALTFKFMSELQCHSNVLQTCSFSIIEIMKFN
uniref:HNH domain-containing protein n=1 Tax=Cannabis sativa TaxID=3483 RepID=A0ABL6V143_CANSA